MTTEGAKMNTNNLSNQPKFNKILVSITRRIMKRLSKCIPILYNRTKNQQIIDEQNRLMQNSNFDVFDILKTAIGLINPVIFAILKDENLRAEITKNAIPTVPDTLRIPIIKILLLQRDEVPHLIVFGSHDSCINDIFDVLKISYENKNVDIIPFDYFTLNFIIILESKNSRTIYLKPEDCLINNQPILYTLIMEFLQLTAKVLHNTKFSTAHLYPRQNVRVCTHGCNFSRINYNDGNNLQHLNIQQSGNEVDSALYRQPEPGTSGMPSPSAHLDPMIERRQIEAAQALLQMQSQEGTFNKSIRRNLHTRHHRRRH